MCVSSSLNDDSPILFSNTDENSLTGAMPTVICDLRLTASLDGSLEFLQADHCAPVIEVDCSCCTNIC